jgi:hypothetical protein
MEGNGVTSELTHHEVCPERLEPETVTYSCTVQGVVELDRARGDWL